MLETIRNRSNGPIAKFIIGLIIVPFAFAGVYSYFNVNTSNAVATVNGEDISLMDFDRSYRFQKQNWGENFDKYFSTDERLQQFRMNVLQQLVNQRLSTQAIQEMGLRTSDQKLRSVIMEVGEFQDENGEFDLTRYNMTLQSMGYSPNQYQAARKNDMASNQFIQSLEATNFVLSNEVQLNKTLQNQKRDIDYLTIPQDFYAKQIDLNNEEGEQAINSYYEMNKSRFTIPERVSIEYIYLTKQNKDGIILSDGQIADYYNDNISNFEVSERRRLAHILVAAAVDADQNTTDAAEQKISDIATRIGAGESFEDLAKETSEDGSTAELGGDLDWIERGMMDETFEDAAFSLQEKGSISAVVRSNFGFHLIKLLDLEQGGPQSLDDSKEQITDILKEQIVEDKYYDLKDTISEKAFEVSDSLDEVAQAANQLVRKSNLFDRQYGMGMPVELQNQPAVLEQIFSDDVLYQGLNSELIELTDGNSVVLRLSEHQESGVSPVTEVREQIMAQLTYQRAREATEKAGNAVIKTLTDGTSAADALGSLPTELPVSWQQQLALSRTGTEVNAQLRDDVFKIPAPEAGQSAYKGILLGTGDYVVVILNAVTDDVVVASEEDNLKLDKQFLDYHSQAEIYSYLKYLDGKASISRSVENTNLVQ
ncbi:MAG: hypothetical protein DRQ47_04065 [Gammaproteobacteria bacterium]|nr:MAG: hypothetical protein DRQ47_04065 [Gammaproteobacteria bacterium]